MRISVFSGWSFEYMASLLHNIRQCHEIFRELDKLYEQLHSFGNATSTMGNNLPSYHGELVLLASARGPSIVYRL